MADVLFDIQGAVGVITLNRPRAINALTQDMCRAIDDQLQTWADDDAVEALLIRGDGGRGLCAGGDVKAVRQAVLDGADPDAFFRHEYAMDQRIAEFGKRVIAIMDGIVMGGGLGISAHADLRILSPRSVLAMPETAIGFFPDVGMLHLLARAGRMGRHLTLTGDTFTAGDALACGIADVVVADIDAAVAALLEDPTLDAADLPGVETVASELAEQPWLAAYDAATPIDVLADLRARGGAEIADLIEQRSPFAVWVSDAAWNRAATLSLAEVFEQDARLARTVVREPDFLEGVRSRLVDKDNAPQWQHATLAEVDGAGIEELVDGE